MHIHTTQYLEFKYFVLKCQDLDPNPPVTTKYPYTLVLSQKKVV